MNFSKAYFSPEFVYFCLSFQKVQNTISNKIFSTFKSLLCIVMFSSFLIVYTCMFSISCWLILPRVLLFIVFLFFKNFDCWSQF